MDGDNIHAFAQLAVEHWKLLRGVSRMLSDLPADQQKRVEAQYRYASNRLKQLTEEVGLRLAEYEGAEFSPNLPVCVINADDFNENDGLMIAQTLEPTVLHNGMVIIMGKVLLEERKATDVSGD
jgi:hypothetical protein